MSVRKYQKLNFTKRALDVLMPQKNSGRQEYSDEGQRGLMIRVSANGNRYFYVRRKVQGRDQRIKLGRYPEITIEQARREAARVMADAESILKNEEEQAEGPDPTVEELFRNYVEGYARLECVRIKEIERDFVRYFYDWRNRRFSTITRLDVQSKVNRLQRDHGRGGANHGIVLMKAATNWNLKRGYISGENPWNCVSAFKMQARDRFLLPKELERFFGAVAQMPNVTVRDYILLSVLTGARQRNLLTMRWDDIDFEMAAWRIPKTKNGDPQLVPLTTAALKLLRQRFEHRDSEWVLPGRIAGQHLVEVKRAWKNVLKEAGITNLRIHDLRRTLGSYMAMNNHSLQIIGKALGHKSTQATQIYARLTYDPVRAAMEQAQAQMLNLGRVPLNVVTIQTLASADETANQGAGDIATL